MNHSLIFWLFLCFPIVSLAQDARDAIVGNYSVSKQGTGGLGTIWMDTLIVRKNISDSSQIFIEVKNGSGDYLYDFHPSDSSFTHPDFPDLIHGAYFANDSIWIYQWLFINSPPFAYEFQGFKTESTVDIADNAANKNLIQIQNTFKDFENFGVASFTINPENDTPETLKTYAKKYGITNPNWHLMTGDKDAIYKLANEGFYIYAAENKDVLGGFEHSGNFALIDKNGFIRSRKDTHGNPIIYYKGIISETEKVDEDGVKEEISALKEDIKKLLNE